MPSPSPVLAADVNKHRVTRAHAHPTDSPAPCQMLSAESMIHTAIGVRRFDLGGMVFCHVEPEGRIEGRINKLNYDGIPYHIELIYNGEMVACPVDRPSDKPRLLHNHTPRLPPGSIRVLPGCA